MNSHSNRFDTAEHRWLSSGNDQRRQKRRSLDSLKDAQLSAFEVCNSTEWPESAIIWTSKIWTPNEAKAAKSGQIEQYPKDLRKKG